MSATIAKDTDYKPFETKIKTTEIKVGELKYMQNAFHALGMLRALGKPELLSWGKSLVEYMTSREPDNPQIPYLKLLMEYAQQVAAIYAADKPYQAMLEAEERKAFTQNAMGVSFDDND